MSTALDTITAAMELVGVLAGDETPKAGDANRALRSLNNMLDSWGTERQFVYVLTDDTITLTGAASYTIGESGTPDVSTVRPLQIDDASFVRVGSSDYPVEVITQDQYDAIPVKSTSGERPYQLYYSPTYPNGTLYVYPAGSGNLYLKSWKSFSSLASLSTSMSFPPGYQRAIEYSLAEEIAPIFNLPLPDSVVRIAQKARRNIKRVNAPRESMGLPWELVKPRYFNIRTGQ